jgi:two-component system sensor histidine kinase VanS
MTINHEIRTPLSVIKGMIEGMIDGIGRYKHKDNYLKEVLVQINSIEDMIKDLTYSLKLEDKAKKDDLCQLSALNQNLLGVIEYARQKKVRVSVDIEDSQVNINEELLSIMIINLMKNAINYTENSLVVLQTKNYHDKVEIIVKNKGFIKESDLDKIFEPYYRLDFSEEGLGVGLFIVKQICEIYNCDYKIYNDNSYVIAKVVLKKPLLT